MILYLLLVCLGKNYLYHSIPSSALTVDLVAGYYNSLSLAFISSTLEFYFVRVFKAGYKLWFNWTSDLNNFKFYFLDLAKGFEIDD